MTTDTKTLQMLRLPLDVPALARLQRARGLPLQADDLGYAVHCALVETFGERAPKPFTVIETRDGMEVLGHAEEELAALRERAAESPPAVRGVVRVDEAESKAMPSAWAAGALYGFRLTACPVVRRSRGKGRRTGPEVDAYLHRLESSGSEPAPSREVVYRGWLEQALDRQGGARLVGAGLAGFRLTRVSRRRQGGERKARVFQRPSATFEGELAVRDPGRFDELVRRGVGRHRSFGFGMLLLRATS